MPISYLTLVPTLRLKKITKLESNSSHSTPVQYPIKIFILTKLQAKILIKITQKFQKDLFNK